GSPSTCAIRKVEARGRKLGARGGRRMCPYGHGLRHVRPPMSAEAWTRGPGAGQVAGRRGVCLAIALRPGTAAMSSIVPPPARRAMRARNAWGPGARVGSSVLFLVVAVGACGVRGAPRDGTAALAPYAGREVESVRFVGAGPFSADTLAGVIETTPSTCTFLGLPICIPFTSVGERTYRLDLEVLERDVRRLELFYRRSGYFGTRVVPAVEPMADDDGVEVTFVIAPGDPVDLDSLGLAGLGGILDTAEVRRRLPLEAGDIFGLGAFAAASDTVRRRLLARGHAYADVLRAYDVDTLLDRATASLTAVPGPIVVVDSILVRGADQLGRRTVLRQLTFRTGDVLVVEQLAESQR